jgi:hypothetical protein
LTADPLFKIKDPVHQLPYHQTRTSSPVVGLVALLLISLLLSIPNQLSEFAVTDLLLFPGELFLITGLLLVPGTYGFVLRILMAALFAVGVILKFADMGTFHVFARPFNPVFDFYFFTNGMNLLQGALGQAAAFVIAFLLLALVGFGIWLAFWLLGKFQHLVLTHSRFSLKLISSLLVLWLGLFFAGWDRAALPFYQHCYSHTRDMLSAFSDLKTFNREIKQSTNTDYSPDTLLAQLAGKDVLVIFVESYGRTLLDKPEFSEHIRPLLQQLSEQLTAKGFAQRSSYFTSPTQGGLSWLAHATAMSGLWVDNQIRYNNLVTSQHPTLNQLFRQAGWRTLGVMPAITMAWPEGNYYGYENIYHSNNMGYAGKAFNWVTMPDQYTLFSLQTQELAKTSRKPIMAEIALISSHAPWTPVPSLVNWNQVGNGEIFNDQASSGDSPEKVWQDNDRIRLQYRLSIEYTLQTLASFIENYGNKNWVVMILGDHQPAPLVTGADTNRDVPVHFITADQSIMDNIENWQWTPGLIPDEHALVKPMSELKDQWIQSFSGK